MTKEQFKALKVGDRVICVYNGGGNGRVKNGYKATISKVSQYDISVSWDDGSRDLETGWSKYSSFNLLSSYDVIDVMNGGALL